MAERSSPVVLGVIPARGGSKGVPRKNLCLVGGVPLVARAVEAARMAKSLNRIIVSTDDEEIARVGREAGAEVPFLRPEDLAGDESLDQDVFRHALRWLAEEEGYVVDYMVTLRPTSPLRLPEHIDGAVEIALTSGADVVKSVTEARVHPHKTWWSAESLMVPVLPSEAWSRSGPDVHRQSLRPAYWQNGLVDVWKANLILNPPASFRAVTFAPFLVKDRYVVDIDSEEDLELAEFLLTQRERAV